MSNKTELSEYSIEAVYTALGVNEDQDELREAVRFVYRQNVSGEFKYTNPSVALTKTIEYVSPRFDALRYYEDDFFPEDNHEHDALIIAVICDEMIAEANNFRIRDQEDGPTDDLPDFGDDYAVNRAERIHDEAVDLVQRGLLPDEEVSPEAVFLAHTNCIRDLLAEIVTIDDCEDDDLATLRRNVAHAKSFLRPDTRLGQELSSVIDEVTREIDARLPRLPSISVSFNDENKYVFFGGLDKQDLAVRRLMTQMPLQERSVEDALKAYWYIMSQYDDDGDDEALKNAESVLEQRLLPFLTYSRDIGMNRTEYETALCSWVLTQALYTESEDYLHLMTDETIAIVQTMNDPSYTTPILSQWLDDKSLFTNIGLSAYVTISKRIYAYEQKQPSKVFALADIQADQSYAQRILGEATPIDCKLAYELRQQAQRLVSFTKPELKRNGFQLI